MIDDSIVRGTTCRRIVRMLKDAGAKEVHVRISSPPFLHPCYFGTDIPSEDQLVAYGKTLDEICESIEADTLAYLHMDRLKELNEGLPYCDACFSEIIQSIHRHRTSEENRVKEFQNHHRSSE